MNSGNSAEVQAEQAKLIEQIYTQEEQTSALAALGDELEHQHQAHDVELIDLEAPEVNTEDKYHFAEDIQEEESLSLHDKELELIRKSLEKYDGKRKEAAQELGISERTLYRKIKQFNL
jgi:transcriptional regulator with PAS, ATPase and Fis domain